MIDHTGIGVSDMTKSKTFYGKALAPLGYAMLMEVEGAAGFGVAPKPDFWIGETDAAISPTHVAFVAATRKDVDAFYAAAISAGGRDNGGPGLRPHYHENYYGAFVLDPDGHNIEAVCHRPA